jgi:Rod binding domain-containing protein
MSSANVSSASQSGMSGIVSLTAGSGPPAKNIDPAKMKQAAQQFEALLITQILHSAHTGDSGWLGTDDSSSSSATDFAEEQLAGTIAQQGGFGLSKMITKELEQQQGRHR